MTRIKTAMAVLLALGFAGAASAQNSPSVGRYYMSKPKAGMEKQFVEGRKKHMDFHKKAGDSFDWMVWEVVTGPEDGSYLIGTAKHAWKDFDGRDDFDAKDTADVAANVGPYTEKSRNAFWIFRPDMSLGNEDGPPAKFLQVIHFHVKPESVGTFIESVQKINEGLKKTNAVTGNPRWYVMANGDDGPLYAVVLERNSWADFQGPSIQERMAEAYGKEEATSLLETIGKCYWGTTSFVLQFHPELSLLHNKM
jgi:hypothetical protein